MIYHLLNYYGIISKRPCKIKCLRRNGVLSMAVYAISDIHGCSAEFKELLNAVSFSEYDELYVIGDAVDRGPDPIGVLRM
ncbi:MAG: metallophosphoesterase, partial [Solobacterium sp.]|nr:metallophosphoesterase [Solobacterium sp.]